MQKAVWFIFLSLAIIVGCSQPIPPASPTPTPPAAANPFLVFDASFFTNRPSVNPYASQLKGLRVLDRGWTYLNNDTSKLPDETSFKEVVRTAQNQDSVTPIAFDFEAWDWACTDTAGNPSDTPKKFETLVKWTREAAPKLKIGFYQIPPITNFWDAQLPETDPKYMAWQKNNDCYKPLANMVDILFPSLYTFYDETSDKYFEGGHIGGWLKYATANIKEARRLSNKPVYPFLWMQYHDSNPTAGLNLIPGPFWKLQLETMQKLADGLVIWGSISKTSSLQKFESLTWDEQSEWWVETKLFLQNLPK